MIPSVDQSFVVSGGALKLATARNRCTWWLDLYLVSLECLVYKDGVQVHTIPIASYRATYSGNVVSLNSADICSAYKSNDQFLSLPKYQVLYPYGLYVKGRSSYVVVSQSSLTHIMLVVKFSPLE